MLSEIYALHESLKRCGVKPVKIHPWVTYPKKAGGFIVGLDKKGQVKRIEFCPAVKMVDIWKLMPSNQQSFPVFNLKIPIWKSSYTEEDICKLLKNINGVDRFKQIVDISKHAIISYDEKELKSLSKRFLDFPAELEKKLSNSNDVKDTLFFELLLRVQATAGDSELFLQQLSETLINSCLNGRIDALSTVEQLLLGKWNSKEGKFEIGKWDSKKKKFKKGDMPIVLDVDNYGDFDCRIFDESIKEKVSSALFKKTEKGGFWEICALSGITGKLEQIKFPEPKLPVLGQSYLFSMNKDALCHYRYGKISVENYPVNRDLVNDLQSSLVFITSPERKGKTWCSVPGNKKKERNLLVAYLEKMPASDIDLASFMVETSQDVSLEGEFETTVKTVCDALKGEKTISPDDHLRIFVLKSVDKGRRQVLFNSMFSVANILQGAEVWQEGAKNHPLFSLMLSFKKGEKAKPVKPFCPSPSAVMRLFHHQWIRNGHESSTVNGCRLSDIYDVFFGDPVSSKQICIRLLRLLLRQTRPLLIGIGGALNSENITTYKVESKKTTLFSIGFLSILLYKLGHKKEVYMNEKFFKIGRILSLADTLHREYGKVVRKDIPNQLLGNIIMKMALDNPQRALDRLNQRLLIYIAWADKAGKEGKLGKWAMKEMGEITKEFEGVEFCSRPDEAERVQMFFGYLARY